MRIGIDLGGSKIEIVALSPEGEAIYRQRVATPNQDYRATLQAIVDLVITLEKTMGDKGSIGVGTPGSVSKKTGMMKNCNSTCLNHQPLQQDLETLLQRPIRLANDANCFSLSEAREGAASQAKVVFGVILGTGVGGGLVVDQQLWKGANGIGGEWGHNLMPGVGTVFEHDSRPCYCGRINCVETFLSGPGMSMTYQQLGGECISAQAIALLAESADIIATEALRRYQMQLALALSQVINLFDPEVIVLGGGVSNIRCLYDQLPELWSPWVFNDQVDTLLVPAKYGDASGVRGAARLWD